MTINGFEPSRHVSTYIRKMLGEDQKKGLHFRNSQTSTGSIRLENHKALYTADFKVKTKKDVFTSEIHIFQLVYWVIFFCYCIKAITSGGQ